jgi:hypothetical protein
MTRKVAWKQTDRLICDEGSQTLWQGIEHNGKMEDTIGKQADKTRRKKIY